MRWLALLVCAACSSSPHAGDARPPPTDADPGAPDAMIRMCGSAPVVPQGASGQIATGKFAITWTPLSGPPDNVNPLVGTTRVTIDVAAGTVHYDSATCAECTFDHHGALDSTGCLLIAAGNDGTPTHDPYYLCQSATGVIAEITWCGYPGPPDARTWRMAGTPP